MGKSGKKVDQAKAEAKKARQALKQEKVATKRNKKENAGEENIDSIIAEFAAKESARTAVTVTVCPQPSPRSNFSLTLIPSGELLMFGGEYCDGQNTEIYNNVYRWNPEKNEWKHIESINTPPPRCSHQAICYKDKLYIFGGEYATLDQFHHYRDLWELDLKTNIWTEIKATGDCPSARSGHRMIVWRGYLVLFGGFYEAMREVRWYNDAYIYSFQDRRWALIPQKPNAQVPKPRSGVTMCLHSNDDTVYIYGGYSKEKVTGSFKEGKVHEDVWALLLKPALANTGGAKGGLSGLDVTRINWQKISRKGDYPSTRCGSAIAMYKQKALLFGGVFDEEGPRHALVSTFYNDLYAFDLDRKRWYKLGLKQKKAKLTSEDRRNTRKLQKLKERNNEDDEDLSDTSDIDNSDSDDEDVNMNDLGTDDNDRAEKGDFFGYIDETGNVVYINLKDEEEVGESDTTTGTSTTVAATGDNGSSSAMIVEEDHGVNDTTSSLQQLQVDNTKTTTVFNSIPTTSTTDDTARMAETLKNQAKYQARLDKATAAANTTINTTTTTDATMVDSTTSSDMLVDNVSGEKACTTDPTTAAAPTTSTTTMEGEPLSAIARYFAALTEPCPRINPSILIRGNTLFIYGGVTELGDTSIPLDDCWSLDLNKRDSWKKVLAGSMHNMVWKGEDGDSDDEYSRSNASRSMRGDDSDDSDSSSGSGDSDSEDEDDSDLEDAMEVETKRSSKSKGKASSSSKKSTSSKGGVRAEMEGLRAHLDTTNSDRTPLSGETLRQFYSRTADVWAKEVIAQWQQQQQAAIDAGTLNKNETLSEKEIKRLGFALSEVRYNELLPLLARLNELEEQQAEEEGPSRQRGSGGRGAAGHSGSSSKGKTGSSEESTKSKAKQGKK